MARKKFVENEDGTEEVIAEETSKTKEKKDYHLSTRGVNIKRAKKSNKDQFFMSYEDGLKLIKKQKEKGKNAQIVQKKALRHVSLPYHMSGKAAMDEACQWIAQNTVGKYKKEYVFFSKVEKSSYLEFELRMNK